MLCQVARRNFTDLSASCFFFLLAASRALPSALKMEAVYSS
jgi:hypothetical protein